MVAFYRTIALINGAIKRNQIEVVIPLSVIVLKMLSIFTRENFIRGYQVLKDDPHSLKVFLSFFEQRPVLKQIISVSRPGRRVYTSAAGLRLGLTKRASQPSVKGSIAGIKKTIVLLNTPNGVLTHAEALITNTGGQVLCIAEI